MNFKYYNLLILSVFSFLLLLSSDLKATHVAGANFEFECLGNNQYRVKLNVFRDCSGAGMPTAASLNRTTQTWISSPCGTISFNWTRDSVTEVSQLCPAQLNQSRCNNGSLPGMQHGHFTAIVTIPPCASGFHELNFSLCCRN